MFQINLPSYPIKVINKNGKPTVFDPLRKRYVALTPEEWVRQHFTHFLIHHKGYPSSLLANEITLALNGMNLRCDSVLYRRNLTPHLIIEYKAPHITINQKVFDQICRYNQILHVDYLIVSNGITHYCCRMDYEQQNYLFLPDIPCYKELL
mgnify:CR=1 FL=1